MKFTKSVTFSLKTIDLIDNYMQYNKSSNFSHSVNMIIQEWDRFKTIALKLQKKDSEH